MGLPEKIIELAAGEIGVKEDPSGSSNVKYNTEYYGGKVNDTGLHWCVVFIWWLFKSLGKSERFFDGGKTASCGTFLSWARRNDLVVDDPQIGALVLFDWNGDGAPDHIEVISSFTSNTITSIGGNTGPRSDIVAEQERNYDNVVAYVWPYREEDIEEDMTQEQFNEMLRKYRAGLQDNDAWDSEESKSARQFVVDTGLMIGGGSLPNGNPNYMWQDFTNREQLAIMFERYSDYTKALISDAISAAIEQYSEELKAMVENCVKKAIAEKE